MVTMPKSVLDSWKERMATAKRCCSSERLSIESRNCFGVGICGSENGSEEARGRQEGKEEEKRKKIDRV
jgi:hypothetical protein